MLLLALDTATTTVTVAVHDGERVLAAVDRPGGRRQAELLLPTIRDALAAAGVDRRDLTHLACGVGPGPYTGLRVGIATALTLGRVLGVPVHGVGTLDALATAARAAGSVEGPFVAVSDAKRREVYWAGYDGDGRCVAGPDVADPAALPDAWRGLPVVGPVPAAFVAAFPDAREPTTVSAADVAALAVAGLAGAAATPLRAAEPLYLRRPDAAERTEEPPLLRRMRWWDVEAVATLEATLFPGTAWSPATFWSELAGVPRTRHYLVAVAPDGALCGYAGLAVMPPDADVQTVAVGPQARGRDIGDLLLVALLAEADRRGCARVHLEVAADNDPAQRLYRRHGFEQVARRRACDGPGRDALVMRADRAAAGGPR